MSALATPRVAALRSFATALGTITGVRPWGGSYANDPTVSQAYATILQTNKFPHLVLLPYQNARSMPATQERYDDFFAVVVIGYVGPVANVVTAETLEHLNRDCKMALLAAGVELLEREPFGPEEVEFYESGHAEFWLPFTARLADALGQ